MDSYSVQTVPLDGAQAMDYNLPGPNQDFPGAALVSDIIYTSNCGTNEIVWTLNMKNGDVIRLTQRIITSLMETLVYDSSNARLDTMEDLQALVEQIDEEVSPDAVVEIYLPPVTYEGELSITKRAVHLFGSSDGEAQTTFTGTVTIAPENYEVIDVRDITFYRARRDRAGGLHRRQFEELCLHRLGYRRSGPGSRLDLRSVLHL